MNVAKVLVVASVVMCCVGAFGQKKEPTAARSPKGLSKHIVEKYNPIPLTTNMISGQLQDETSGKYHYYTFMAGPGEITLTLSVESYPRSSSNGASFTLFDNNEQWMGGGSTMSIPSMPHQTVTEISIPTKQPVLLRITEGVNFGIGKYRIQISGLVELGVNDSTVPPKQTEDLTDAERYVFGVGNGSTARAKEKPDSFSCLPKRGTLIVKMKDGSKNIIDLSEAETITIVP